MILEEVVERWKSAEYKNRPLNSTHSAAGTTSCGDRMRVDLEISDGKVVNASYSSIGCVLSQGVADFLCEQLIGKSIEEAKAFDITNQFEFELSPARHGCAILSRTLMRQALDA